MSVDLLSGVGDFALNLRSIVSTRADFGMVFDDDWSDLILASTVTLALSESEPIASTFFSSDGKCTGDFERVLMGVRSTTQSSRWQTLTGVVGSVKLVRVDFGETVTVGFKSFRLHKDCSNVC